MQNCARQETVTDKKCGFADITICLTDCPGYFRAVCFDAERECTIAVCLWFRVMITFVVILLLCQVL